MRDDVPKRPVVAAGAIVWRGDEVLLIRRGKAPRKGEWSIPGGRVEWGETAREAAHRETLEETGCEVEILGPCDVVEFIDADFHNVLIDFTARWLSGDPMAGDDAIEAQFVALDEIGGYGLWEATLDMIRKSHRQRLQLMDDRP